MIRLQKRLGSQLFRADEGEGDGFLVAECKDCVMAFVDTECLVSGGSFLSSDNGLKFSRTGRGVDFSDVNRDDWRVSLVIFRAMLCQMTKSPYLTFINANCAWLHPRLMTFQ